MLTTKHTSPWLHWTCRHFLSDQCLSELKAVDCLTPQQISGKRVGGDRFFVDATVKDHLPHLYQLWLDLHNGAVKHYFEDQTGCSFSGLYPRVEVISDIGDFYLEPHCDLPEKKLTALVYTDYQRLWPGTQLEPNYRVPVEDNLCLFFMPGSDTWHSYPQTHFDCVRRALQINYWTYSLSTELNHQTMPAQ